jgi:hypothetical protein
MGETPPGKGKCGSTDCAVSDTCIDHCAERTPNGCDCFGCCEILRDDGSTLQVTLDDSCSLAKLDDKKACPRCVPYLLWDTSPDKINEGDCKWTSIRLSPQQNLELGRVHGTFNAAFGATRSQTFSLGLALLSQYLEDYPLENSTLRLEEIRATIARNYL